MVIINCQYIQSAQKGVLGLGVGVGIRFCALDNSPMCA